MKFLFRAHINTKTNVVLVTAHCGNEKRFADLGTLEFKLNEWEKFKSIIGAGYASTNIECEVQESYD